MKNIQIIDGAVNATFSVFEATDDEFESIFPGPGQDLEIVEDYIIRVGEHAASETLSKLWGRPIYKPDVQGIHGTIFYDYKDKSKYLPKSRCEKDRAPGQLNESERVLYSRFRESEER